MPKLLASQEVKNYNDSDDENLVPPGDYRVKIKSVDRSERNPDVLEWRFRIMSGQPSADRELRAWTSTAPNGAWALKRLIKHLIHDPATVQHEDLEGRIVKATVSVEMRTDNGELTNRVRKLSPWDGDPASGDGDDRGGFAVDDEDNPF